MKQEKKKLKRKNKNQENICNAVSILERIGAEREVLR